MRSETIGIKLVDVFWRSHNGMVHSARLLTSDPPSLISQDALKLFVRNTEVHSQICHAIAFCF